MIKKFTNNMFGTIYHSDNNTKLSTDTVKGILNIHLIYNIIVLSCIFYLHSAWSLLLCLFITHPNVEIKEGKSYIAVYLWWIALIKSFKTN